MGSLSRPTPCVLCKFAHHDEPRQTHIRKPRTTLKQVPVPSGPEPDHTCGILNPYPWRLSMEEQRPQPGQVQIKADEKELQGSYSNLVMIHHFVEEFTLNFI